MEGCSAWAGLSLGWHMEGLQMCSRENGVSSTMPLCFVSIITNATGTWATRPGTHDAWPAYPLFPGLRSVPSTQETAAHVCRMGGWSWCLSHRVPG